MGVVREPVTFYEELCCQDRDSVPPSSGQEIENTQTHPKSYPYQNIAMVSHYPSFPPILKRHLTITFLDFYFIFAIPSSKKIRTQRTLEFQRTAFRIQNVKATAVESVAAGRHS